MRPPPVQNASNINYTGPRKGMASVHQGIDFGFQFLDLSLHFELIRYNPDPVGPWQRDFFITT
jgi:hypothetical protein